MTASYLLRLTGGQRDWLLANLHGLPDETGTAIVLYGRLLDCEAHDPREVPMPAPEPYRASRDEVLQRAASLIGGERATTYGSAAESFARIAELWGTLLGAEVTATMVARMMIAMKLSRLTRDDAHADSWVDIAGYAALGAEIAEVEL